MWSASSPWPVISWKRTPPKPPPTTTGIEPAGAGPASSRVSALRAALGGDRAGVVVEELEAAVGAERLGARLDRAVAPRHGLGADPHAGAVVAGEEALGVGDADLAAHLGVGGRELGDLGTGAAAALVQLAQQLRLALGGDLGRRRSIGCGVVATALQRPWLGALGAQRRRRLAGGPLDVGGVEPVDVGEVGGAAADHPHPGALGRPPPAPLRPATRRSPSSARRCVRRRPRRSRRRWRAPGEDALGDLGLDQLAHGFGRFPATSIKRPAATKSSAPASESPAWSLARPSG